MAVIFISCGTQSGVQALITRLYDHKGINCISRQDLIKEVSSHGEWATQVIDQLSDATYSYENFTRNRRTYIVLMRKALLEKIREDNVIYYGIYGHLLVPRFKHFVRIRVNAPLYMRVPLTMERLRCDEKSAREYIGKSNANQIRWARFMYGVDIENSSLYDLNINLGHLSLPVICNLIEHILQKSDLQINSELKNRIDKTLLGANVEAALTIDPRTRNFEIDAQMENGSLRLIGPYLNNTEIAIVKEIARKVSGSERIDYSAGYVFICKSEEQQAYLAPQTDKKLGLIHPGIS